MWLVIWMTATRLTAARPASTTPRPPRPKRPQRPQRSATSTTATQTARSASVTAVATATLAWVQSWVSTAGSARAKPAPTPAVGTDVPAYAATATAATMVGGAMHAA